jgi:cob(I)alamin adenosyltransferase
MRLTKISTKTGDGGTTHFANNKRVSKGSSIITAIGRVDSLNAQLGMLLCELEELKESGHRVQIQDIQQDLFDIGGELFMGHPGLLHESSLTDVEYSSGNLLANLSPLKEFIMPRGARMVCQTHICRTACREAETAMVAAKDDGYNVGSIALQYINRLSDYLFNLARHLDHSKEVLWARDR